LRFLVSTVVLFSAVIGIGQVQPPPISIIHDHRSPIHSQPDLEFLLTGLHPTFGPADTGGGFSIGVYHSWSCREQPDCTPPLLFYAPAPIYPSGLIKQQKISVRVWFIVWLDGTTRYVRVLRSEGERFDAAAINAVSTWRYYPGAKAGHVWFFDTTAEVTFLPRCTTRDCR
jgi:TonB family protein